MTPLPRSSPVVTVFHASAPEGIWQITRDGALKSQYQARGDAIRAACLAARDVESRGGRAEVRLAPEGTTISHWEPQFDSPKQSALHTIRSQRPQ